MPRITRITRIKKEIEIAIICLFTVKDYRGAASLIQSKKFMNAPRNDVYEVRHCESPYMILLFCKNVLGDEAISRYVHKVKIQEKFPLPNRGIATAHGIQDNLKSILALRNDGKDDDSTSKSQDCHSGRNSL